MKGERHQQRDMERGRGTGRHLLWAFLALVLYVLSIGPAAWLYDRADRAANAGLKATIEVVYAPVVFVFDKTPLGPLGWWWIGLWSDDVRIN